jgi:pimeloyl-ACP methyl ester carboxylesterase
MRAHRAFRQLAVQLTQAGFPVLRFDYFGCGDSAGESDEGNIAHWMSDIGLAIDELKDMSGVTKVSLIGARLGATLATLVGTPRSDIEHIVLWEPIVNGKEYMEELLALHQQWLQDAITKPKPTDRNDGNEILGFPLTSTLRRELEAIDLLTLQHRPALQLYIIESTTTMQTSRLRDHLTTLDFSVDYQYIPGPKIWIKEASMDQALVPGQILQAIVSWMSRG